MNYHVLPSRIHCTGILCCVLLCPKWKAKALVLSNETHGIEKSTLGIQDFQQRSQNFDIMMVSWWWFHDLKIWNAQNLIMSNFENQEILIMSKFENIKNLIMSKIEMYQKSDHVKIWESQKSDHVKNENPRFRKKKTDVDVIMKTWNIFSCCVCFHQGFLMDFWTFIKVCFYIFMFFRWWCYHVLVVMISKHGIPKIWWCQKLTILQIGSWQLFWVLQKSGSSQNDLIMMMVSWSHHDDGVMTATASSESQSLDFCNPLSTDLTIFFLCVPVDHPLCLQTDPKMASFFVLIGKSREYTHSASVEQS